MMMMSFLPESRSLQEIMGEQLAL